MTRRRQGWSVGQSATRAGQVGKAELWHVSFILAVQVSFEVSKIRISRRSSARGPGADALLLHCSVRGRGRIGAASGSGWGRGRGRT
jgi:hypothetical protein